MVNKRLSHRVRTFLLVLLCIGLLCFAMGQTIAESDKGGKDEQEKAALPRKANIFVYPEILTAKDKLVDGPGEKGIEIKSETTLVWIDLAPDYRFAHATEYLLISAEGTRAFKGQWWPVLNGKALFRDGKSYKVDFPFKLTHK